MSLQITDTLETNAPLHSLQFIRISLALLLPPCLLTEIVMINDCIFAFCSLRPPVSLPALPALYLMAITVVHSSHHLSNYLRLRCRSMHTHATIDHFTSTSIALFISLSPLLSSQARLLERNHFSEATFHSTRTAFAINVTFSSIESC